MQSESKWVNVPPPPSGYQSPRKPFAQFLSLICTHLRSLCAQMQSRKSRKRLPCSFSTRWKCINKFQKQTSVREAGARTDTQTLLLHSEGSKEWKHFEIIQVKGSTWGLWSTAVLPSSLGSGHLFFVLALVTKRKWVGCTKRHSKCNGGRGLQANKHSNKNKNKINKSLKRFF